MSNSGEVETETDEFEKETELMISGQKRDFVLSLTSRKEWNEKVEELEEQADSVEEAEEMAEEIINEMKDDILFDIKEEAKEQGTPDLVAEEAFSQVGEPLLKELLDQVDIESD